MPWLLSDPLMIAVRGLAIVVIISSLEYLNLYRFIKGVGFLSWKVGKLYRNELDFVIEKAHLNWLMDRHGYTLMLFIRSVAAVVLLVGEYRSILGALALSYVFLSTGAMLLRHPYGLDGSDHMTLFVSGATLLPAVLANSQLAYMIAMGFIFAQLCLAYVTAGMAKLVSPLWRNGSALVSIMGSNVFGHPQVWAILKRVPFLALLLAWSVIIWETLFPLLLCIEGVRLGALALGIAFHVFNSLIMGLNRFAILFVSCYPVMYYFASYCL